MLTDQDKKDIKQIVTEAGQEAFLTKGEADHFLGKKDIPLLIKAFREIFATKEELLEFKDEMHTSFSELQTTVDGYAKKMKDHDTELKVLNHRATKLENPA
jgi:hypothetical protein